MKLICVFAISIICNIAVAQKIHLGMDTDSVELLIGQEVQVHYSSYLVKMNARTIDQKGKAKDVILCKENIPSELLDKGISFCTHYISDGDTVSHIVTEYKNISLSAYFYDKA